MSERILFVDDDANLLASCERNFRRQFQLDTAEGGEAGLEKLAQRGPYAVVVCDMQMPGMNGIEFLSAVRQRAPDTVRIMLTGNADLDVAIRVVNEGNIFRFLTKPCPPETLGKAVEDARAQYRLVTAEKELLNKTLSGSIKLLTDILSAVEAQSFGRAEKLRKLIAEIAHKIQVDNAWEIHLAAMLSPIGNVTLPVDTLVKARSGVPLNHVEEQLVKSVPEIGARLLSNIPRLDGVAKIVRYRNKRFDGSGLPEDTISGAAIPLGARLLAILEDMQRVQSNGLPALKALAEIEQRQGWYDPELISVVRTCLGGDEADAADKRVISVGIGELRAGMVLHSDVFTKDGTLVLSAGHEMNEMTLEKLQNFEQLSGIKEPIFVEAPPAES